MTSQLEFVNDWSELEAAIEVIASEDWGNSLSYTMRVIAEYVPRLLTQYASLVELSFALTEGWEQYASLQPPTGLYLPDHS